MSKIIIITGLGFGDETKGATVDYLARQMSSSLVVRYNGGAQAAHNVVAPGNVRHCFAQFGSGTFIPNSQTFLSQEMLLEPLNLLVEADFLKRAGVADPLSQMIISPRATIITPFQKMVGQIKELSRGQNRLGSCGMGIGETVFDRDCDLSIQVEDISDIIFLRCKLNEIKHRRWAEAREIYQQFPTEAIQERLNYFEETAKVEELIRFYLDFASLVNISDSTIEDALALDTSLIFEGAQGALLDKAYGFRPYISKTTCTYHNVEGLLSEAAPDVVWPVEKIGLLRAYHHRHGAGPLPTEDKTLSSIVRDESNKTNRWQGNFRVGWFDTVLARYGLALNEGVSYLGLNCLDQLTGIPEIKICTSYLYQGPLNLLGNNCDWFELGPNQAVIQSIRKPPEKTGQNTLTEILSKCQPRDFLKLPGWKEDISETGSWEDLPSNAQTYIRTIEQLLNAPIGLVSVNPSATGRLTVNS